VNFDALDEIFDQIAPEVLQLAVREIPREIDRRIANNKLSDYVPYAKQQEFHNAGVQYRERLFLAGNRCGKTMAGAFELASHLTGIYPPWWCGKRFEKPVRAWAAGITGESTRDVVQEKLFGPPDRRDAWGTGAIPKANLGDILMGRGIANAIDLVSVKHISGDWSSLAFKSYEKGREKWQGAALEVVWMDEEPPSDLYYEGLTRTNETGGLVYITCTPLLGMSDVMRMFLMDS
jgi:phage terminase large subunit-like protein